MHTRMHGCLDAARPASTPSMREDVYQSAGVQDLVEAAAGGYHATVFAYGQTGGFNVIGGVTLVGGVKVIGGVTLVGGVNATGSISEVGSIRQVDQFERWGPPGRRHESRLSAQGWWW
eukprot:201872-Chlamydomonas_euryale.AAC.2